MSTQYEVRIPETKTEKQIVRSFATKKEAWVFLQAFLGRKPLWCNQNHAKVSWEVYSPARGRKGWAEAKLWEVDGKWVLEDDGVGYIFGGEPGKRPPMAQKPW